MTEISSSNIIPPLSIVQITRVTADEPDWKQHLGRIYRIGYYRPTDGLDCVWLVDDTGIYCETVDQEMISTHFRILYLSDETDLFGINRPIIKPS